MLLQGDLMLYTAIWIVAAAAFVYAVWWILIYKILGIGNGPLSG